jgi:hypothetical protein
VPKPGGVLAAQRPRGAATFGAPETITDEPQPEGPAGPAVALDPSTDRPVVALGGQAGVLVSVRSG